MKCVLKPRKSNTLNGSQRSIGVLSRKAPGYAIFSNTGVNLLLFSTARGGGILRDHRDGTDTYMKAFGAGTGLGVGLKKFTAVIVFESEAALEVLNGKADATIYDLPFCATFMAESGFALQALAQGFKFWADPKLND